MNLDTKDSYEGKGHNIVSGEQDSNIVQGVKDNAKSVAQQTTGADLLGKTKSSLMDKIASKLPSAIQGVVKAKGASVIGKMVGKVAGNAIAGKALGKLTGKIGGLASSAINGAISKQVQGILTRVPGQKGIKQAQKVLKQNKTSGSSTTESSSDTKTKANAKRNSDNKIDISKLPKNIIMH